MHQYDTMGCLREPCTQGYNSLKSKFISRFHLVGFPAPPPTLQVQSVPLNVNIIPSKYNHHRPMKSEPSNRQQLFKCNHDSTIQTYWVPILNATRQVQPTCPTSNQPASSQPRCGNNWHFPPKPNSSRNAMIDHLLSQT